MRNEPNGIVMIVGTHYAARFEEVPMRYAMFAFMAVPLLILGCRNSATRSHETCVKESIFALQRATDKVAAASGYEEALAALESIRTEASKLKQLREEFAAFGEPSRWERSRMRKHRALFASANEKWTAALTEMRRRMDDGEFPPDMRQNLDEALTAFEAERKKTNDAIEPFWDS